MTSPSSTGLRLLDYSDQEHKLLIMDQPGSHKEMASMLADQ
jgi:hypothetical protein